MNCNDVTRLLNAHADSELDLATSITVEEHLESCSGCRRSLVVLQAARTAIAGHVELPPAPYGLRRQIELRLGRSAEGRFVAALRSPFAAVAPGVVALLLVGWLLVAGPTYRPAAASNVVYHISQSEAATPALRNLANHLSASPGVTIIVVAHNDGVDFLLDGARDAGGEPYAKAVRHFAGRGVKFRICNNTLERRGIASGKVIPEATLVPSGIAEIGRLQSQEGFSYLRL